jgi:Zn-dependent protease with chaperone function
MHLALILAIVAAYGIAEYAPHEPLPREGVWHALGALAMIAAVAAIASLTSIIAARRIRRDSDDSERLIARFEGWKKLHVVAWLFGAAIVLWVCHWPQLVRYQWHLESWVILDDLLILAPVVLPLLWIWAWHADVDMAARAWEPGGTAAGAAPTSGQRRVVPDPTSRARARWSSACLHARHFLLLPLVPVLCLVLVHDVADHVAPGWKTSAWSWLVYAIPLLLVGLGLPLLLRWFFLATPLAQGPLRSRLEAAASRAGVAPRDILVWNTGGRVVNAAAVGFLRPLRYVFLSDALLERLAPGEIEAVFLHEAAHLRRRHLLVRLAAMCLPVAMLMALHAALDSSWEPAAQASATLGIAAAEPGIGFEPGVILMSAACVVGVLFALRLSSRVCEHDADLWAARWMTAPQAEQVPDATGAASMIAALRRLEAEAPRSRRRATWLHPSERERVEFLRRAALQPGFASGFSTRLRWMCGFGGATLAAALVMALLFA